MAALNVMLLAVSTFSNPKNLNSTMVSITESCCHKKRRQPEAYKCSFLQTQNLHWELHLHSSSKDNQKNKIKDEEFALRKLQSYDLMGNENIISLNIYNNLGHADLVLRKIADSEINDLTWGSVPCKTDTSREKDNITCLQLLSYVNLPLHYLPRPTLRPE